jgi:hypothetical protein
MKKIYTLILLLPIISFAQGKTFLDFNNELTPVYPGCEGAENILECYTNKIGMLVRDIVNVDYAVNKAFPDEISIELLVMNHPSGESVVKTVRTSNPELEAFVREALKKLPPVTPPVAYGGDPGTSSNRFTVTLRRDAAKQQYELVMPESTTEKWKKEPHPFAGAITPALFPGCESKAVDKQCNANVFREWLMAAIDGKIKNPVQETVMLRLHFNDKGMLEKPEFETQSAELRKVLEAVLKKFPRITPATMSGKAISTTYALPVYFNIKP